VEGQYLPFLGAHFSLQKAYDLVLLLQTVEQLLLVLLEELYFFEEDGQHPFVFVVLNLLLIALDPPLVLG
jgi:hypothetical protein